MPDINEIWILSPDFITLTNIKFYEIPPPPIVSPADT